MSEILNLPDLHDWEINEVRVNHSLKTVDLYLSDPINGQRIKLYFNGVKKLYISGMMIQNVILDFLMFDGDSSSEYFNYCKEMLGISEVESDFFILYIEPSVGMEVVCYFHYLEVDTINK